MLRVLELGLREYILEVLIALVERCRVVELVLELDVWAPDRLVIGVVVIAVGWVVHIALEVMGLIHEGL